MNFKKTIIEFEKNFDEKKVVRIKDMLNSFKKNISVRKDKIVYEVFIKKLSPINLGLTVIYPGNVNKEYFMTKGHFHENKSKEFYVLLEGKGILLLQKKNTKVMRLKPGEIVLISGDFAHRLINIGDKKLKVLTVYDENSGPNYNVKFNKRFFKNEN